MDTFDKLDTTQDTEDAVETISRDELEVFNDYLTSISTALLDVESTDYFHKFIHTEENLNIIRTFLSDKQNRSLIVSKIEEFSKLIGEDEGKGDQRDTTQDTIETEDNKSIVSIALDLKITYRGVDAQSIAFIKRQHVSMLNLKDARRGIGKQLQILNLGYVGEETDLFRLANIYVDNGLIPLFASYKSKKSSEDNLDHIDEIEQLLAKLRLEFTHCTQDQISYIVKLEVPKKIKEKKETITEDRQLKDDDFEEELKDPTFFELLRKSLIGWTKDIQKVTYMSTDFPIDSVLTEITFWKNRENSLQSIQEQLEHPEIKLALDLLSKDTAQSSVVFSFLQNINVIHEIKKAQEFNLILKDIPVNGLIAANDLKTTQKSINDMFSHFKAFKTGGSYPVKRIMDLLEALSSDSSNRILKILEDVDPMTVESKQFEVIKEECLNIFSGFDKNLKIFLDSIRSKYPKRPDRKAMSRKLELEHVNIRERINEIADQRRENEKLLEIVSSVFSEEGETRNREAIKDIRDAYTVFFSINVLNMSIDGENKWQKAKKEYNMKIDRVEEEITSQMRDRLASAKTTNEMFNTFSKFNALFSRPRIRGAIQEYQNQILSSIKKDIKNFRDRFLVKYGSSEVCKMYKVKNFPSLSGLLTWYRQLERKLQVYLDRVQAVLGAGWEKHVAGKQLKQQIEPIAKHLEEMTQSHYQNWVNEMTKVQLFTKSGIRIFKITTKSDGSLKLEVNFSQKGLQLFKEKNNLKYLGEKMSYSLIMKTQEVALIYPKYISLVDSLATFNQVNNKITPEIAMLLASKRKRIHSNLKAGDKITWKDERNLESY
jgi:dynein heavy chain 1